MRKHILGFALFSLIVGASVYASILFYKASVSPPAKSMTEPFRPEINFGNVKYGTATIDVSQAVINLKNKKLDMNFSVKRDDDSTDAVFIIFWFYAKDGEKTRFLEREVVRLTPDFDSRKIAALSDSYSFDWFDELKPNENLYVIPQFYGGGHMFVPEFDKAKATAILSAEK